MSSQKIVLRLMNEKGRYPNNSFLSKNVSFISDKRCGFIYSIVRTDFEDSQYFNSEISWALVTEIKLWSSIMLSIPKDEGIFTIYPNNIPIELEDTNFLNQDFNSEQFLDSMRLYLSKKIQGINLSRDIRNSISDTSFDTKVQDTLFSRIRCADHILIRGLSFLIKSQILISTNVYLFIEEALLLLYLAIEAALLIIRNNMIKHGHNEPSFTDVFKIINEKYLPDIDLSDLTDYFKACYENRILLVHPDNKYKVSGIPNLAADDYFDTYVNMIEFYRDILINDDLGILC